MTTTLTPEQAQTTMNALVIKQQKAWRSLVIRCETGKPFTHKDQTEIMDVGVQLLDVHLGFFRRSAKTSRPLVSISELMDMAERVTVRLQDIVQRLCR